MGGIVVEVADEDKAYERRRQNDLDAEIARDLISNAKSVRPRSNSYQLELEMANGDRHIVQYEDGAGWFIVNF